MLHTAYNIYSKVRCSAVQERYSIARRTGSVRPPHTLPVCSLLLPPAACRLPPAACRLPPILQVGKHAEALRMALRLGSRELAERALGGCGEDAAAKKQLAYILGRHGLAVNLEEGPAAEGLGDDLREQLTQIVRWVRPARLEGVGGAGGRMESLLVSCRAAASALAHTHALLLPPPCSLSRHHTLLATPLYRDAATRGSASSTWPLPATWTSWRPRRPRTSTRCTWWRGAPPRVSAGLGGCHWLRGSLDGV